jgi:signal transduction histidine kinase
LHAGATDLPPWLRDVVAALGRRWRWTLQLADLPVLAQVDPTRVRLLLRNLLENTRRHSGDAPQPPVLSLQRDGAQVRLTVRDFGPGVDEAALPHLAEPFYRPEAARTRSNGGVGLGLFLCRQVALAHGGTFQIRNAQPGLQVVVTLPIR